MGLDVTPPPRAAIAGGTTEPALRDLVSRAVDGDRQAEEALLASLRPMVVRYCRARLAGAPGADDAAQDAAQEALMAVLAAMPRYEDRGRPFEAFVFGIAAHKVGDILRAPGRRFVPVADHVDTGDTAPTPEDHIVRDDAAREARLLLDQLPDRLCDVVTLRVLVGLSVEETGRALDMSPGAVRVAQHRALARLRTLVTPDVSA